MAGTIYLISGANRGIGLALVNNILTKRLDSFVYAGARNPEKAVELQALKKAYPERISVVKCVSADVEGNAELAKEIEARHGRLDTLIASAAIGYDSAPAAEASIPDFEAHLRVNVAGPLALFQAVYRLLRKSATPRFVPISSHMASLDGFLIKIPATTYIGYGASKAALNWVTRKIHYENEWIVAFPYTPGPVNTGMFQQAVADDTSGNMQNYVHLAAKPENAVAIMLDIIDNSTREANGGDFMNYKGEKEVW